MPAQITVRADQELVDRVRAAARRAGRSMNEHVVIVLDAATDPELAGDEAEALRERLARAGLLFDVSRRTVARPAEEQLAAARRHAGRGTPLSQLVSDSR